MIFIFLHNGNISFLKGIVLKQSSDNCLSSRDHLAFSLGLHLWMEIWIEIETFFFGRACGVIPGPGVSQTSQQQLCQILNPQSHQRTPEIETFLKVIKQEEIQYWINKYSKTNI